MAKKSNEIIMKKTKGVIYITTGKKYVEEVIRSAASLKKHMPKLPITIFSDEELSSSLFDKVIKIKNPKYRMEDKSENISKSPYDYTLFLDADTYICDDISELFELLNRFDIGLAHAKIRKDYFRKGIPDSFPEFNGGVILFKKSPKMNNFFSEWRKLYSKDKNKDVSNFYSEEFLKYKGKEFLSRKKEITIKKGINEQPSLGEALYKSNLRISILPEEYNLRMSIGYVGGKVKIIHTHAKNPEKIAEIINSKIRPRIYMQEKDFKVIYPNYSFSLKSKILNIFKIFTNKLK